MDFKLSKEQFFVRKMVREFEKQKISWEEAVRRLSYMYRANNTFMDGRRIEVEMAIQACNMQIPKPPSYEGKDPTCGECGTYIFKRDRFCPRCGQKIKWGENNG